MLDPNAIRERILGTLPGSEVEVRDTTGTGDHFEARVVSPARSDPAPGSENSWHQISSPRSIGSM